MDISMVLTPDPACPLVSVRNKSKLQISSAKACCWNDSYVLCCTLLVLDQISCSLSLESPTTGRLPLLLLAVGSRSPEDCVMVSQTLSSVVATGRCIPWRKSAVRRLILEWIYAFAWLEMKRQGTAARPNLTLEALMW